MAKSRLNSQSKSYPLDLCCLLVSAILAIPFTEELMRLLFSIPVEDNSFLKKHAGIIFTEPVNPLMQACTNITLGIGLILGLAGIGLLAYQGIRSLLGFLLVLGGASSAFTLFGTFSCNITDLFDHTFLRLAYGVLHLTVLYVVVFYCINALVQTACYRLFKIAPLFGEPEATNHGWFATKLFVYSHLAFFLYSLRSWDFFLALPWLLLMLPLFILIHWGAERRMNVLQLSSGKKVMFRILAVAVSSVDHLMVLIFTNLHVRSSDGLGTALFNGLVWWVMLLLWFCSLLVLLPKRKPKLQLLLKRRPQPRSV